MRVTKKPNINKYKNAIKKMSDRATLVPAINETIVEIRKRTQSGKDVNGNSFKPYAESTKDYRSKHGRSTNVNLTYSGAMLGSITVKSIQGGIRLYFGSTIENTKAYHNQISLKRKFFGLSQAQRDKLIKFLKSYYKNATV
jgi:hypothetical protein